MEDNSLVQYHNSSDILSDMREIIESSRNQAYRTVDLILLRRNWLMGKRIAEEELKDTSRTENYGLEIIKNLSKSLSAEYGKGFTKTNLYSFYSFYKNYPEIFQTASGKSSPIMLSWSHYVVLLQVHDKSARDWYTKEAYEQTWSVRTLQRNISTQYYYRLLASQKKDLVEGEMLNKAENYQKDKLEYMKNPVIAEFLGLSSSTDITETDKDFFLSSSEGKRRS